MADKGKDGETPFTFNSIGTFSLGTAPAGEGDLTTTSIPAVTAQVGNLALAPKGEEGDDEFPPEIINRLVGLKQLQEEYDNLDEQYKAERVALEKKYFDLRSPVLSRRSDVISGKVDVEVEIDGAPSNPGTSSVKGIPGFWLQCMANHPTVSTLLGEGDGPALEALTDVKLEYLEDYSGFKLSFHFAPNEFFTNEVLSKSYTVNPDLLDDTTPALTAVDGTIIEWKDKKNLCETETKKKQKSKKGGQTRYVTQKTPKQSFFHWFADPHMGDDEEEEGEEEGESPKAHEFQLSIDADYEVGHVFRSEIIPQAIMWFTGEAEGDDLDLLGDEDDEDDEEEDDEDDDENPAEESEEVEVSGKKKSKGKHPQGGAGAGGAGGAAGEQPECKQS